MHSILFTDLTSIEQEHLSGGGKKLNKVKKRKIRISSTSDGSVEISQSSSTLADSNNITENTVEIVFGDPLSEIVISQSNGATIVRKKNK